MKRIALSAEEKDILSKLDSKRLSVLSEVSDKYSKDLLYVMNVLLDRDKEWFMTDTEVDPHQLAKKHYAFRSNFLMFKKFLRLIQNAQHELSKREEVTKK